MESAILLRPKLQSLSRYTTNLPTNSNRYSPFMVQCSINSKKLTGTERITFPLQSFPTQSPIPLIKNSSISLISRKDSNFITQSLGKDSNFELKEEKEKDFFVFQREIQRIVIAGLVLGLLGYDACVALAATGGRMGGRTSSSTSSSKSSSISSSSSYSSRSSSSPSSSYSSSYSSPSSSSTSFSYTSSTGIAPSPVRVSSGDHPGSGVAFFVLFIGTSFLMSAILGSRDQEMGNVVSGEKTSIIKLQVRLLGMARSLQKDLDQIAEVADTSTSEGLNYILRETVLALLRHPDCCISCYSSVDVKGNSEDGEKHFDQLSIEERGKLDEETLVNVNNIKRKTKSKKPQNNETRNEYIVITILVSSEGTHKLPCINSSSDLKEALQQLGSISSRKITAVEVLWTPQEEKDTLLEDELLENYPLLRQLQDG